jgi:hypothetical protein
VYGAVSSKVEHGLTARRRSAPLPMHGLVVYFTGVAQKGLGRCGEGASGCPRSPSAIRTATAVSAAMAADRNGEDVEPRHAGSHDAPRTASGLPAFDFSVGRCSTKALCSLRLWSGPAAWATASAAEPRRRDSRAGWHHGGDHRGDGCGEDELVPTSTGGWGVRSGPRSLGKSDSNGDAGRRLRPSGKAAAMVRPRQRGGSVAS